MNVSLRHTRPALWRGLRFLCHVAGVQGCCREATAATIALILASEVVAAKAGLILWIVPCCSKRAIASPASISAGTSGQPSQLYRDLAPFKTLLAIPETRVG